MTRPAPISPAELLRRVTDNSTVRRIRYGFTNVQPTFRGKAIAWRLNEDVLELQLLRRPCNEIGTLMLEELEELIPFLKSGAADARALVIYSSVDKGFCAGADLKELYRNMSEANRRQRRKARTELRAFLDRVHNVFDELDGSRIPTVAAVHGFCFGGGLELALTCDVIVADQSARFAFPELRLGLIPGFGGVPRLERDVGNAVCRDLLFTGRSINAKRAQHIGLISQVVGRGNALSAAYGVAKQMTRFDKRTLRTAKRFVKAIPRTRLEAEKETFLRLFESPVVEAALEKFVNSDDVRPYLP